MKGERRVRRRRARAREIRRRLEKRPRRRVTRRKTTSDSGTASVVIPCCTLALIIQDVSTIFHLVLPFPLHIESAYISAIQHECRDIYVTTTTSTIFSQAAASTAVGSRRAYLALSMIFAYELMNRRIAPLSPMPSAASNNGSSERGGEGVRSDGGARTDTRREWLDQSFDVLMIGRVERMYVRKCWFSHLVPAWSTRCTPLRYRLTGSTPTFLFTHGSLGDVRNDSGPRVFRHDMISDLLKTAEFSAPTLSIDHHEWISSV